MSLLEEFRLRRAPPVRCEHKLRVVFELRRRGLAVPRHQHRVAPGMLVCAAVWPAELMLAAHHCLATALFAFFPPCQFSLAKANAIKPAGTSARRCGNQGKLWLPGVL